MKQELITDIAIGVAGGIAGSFAMTWLSKRAFDSGMREGLPLRPITPQTGKQFYGLDGKLAYAGDSAAEVTNGGKKAAVFTHYLFGALAGSAYPVLAKAYPPVTYGAGVVYGAAVWLIADEASLPVTGLAPAPTRLPLKRHALMLGNHLLFGLVLELVRKGLRKSKAGEASQRHP